MQPHRIIPTLDVADSASPFRWSLRPKPKARCCRRISSLPDVRRRPGRDGRRRHSRRRATGCGFVLRVAADEADAWHPPRSPLSPSADPVAVAPAARPRQQQLAVVSLRLEGFHAKESGENLISAAEQAGSADYYRSAGAVDLPFENCSFDLAVAYKVLMDIEDVPAALKEIRRVLPSLGNPC
jgi:hypothetical protein